MPVPVSPMRTLVSRGATLEGDSAKNIALVKAEVHVLKGNDWLARGGAHPGKWLSGGRQRHVVTRLIIDAKARLAVTFCARLDYLGPAAPNQNFAPPARKRETLVRKKSETRIITEETTTAWVVARPTPSRAAANGQTLVAADGGENKAKDHRLGHALHEVGKLQGVDGAGPELHRLPMRKVK